MIDKDQITGQTAAAVGRSVELFRSNCTDASTQTPWVKYTLEREKKFCLAEKWSG